jgi:molecular chaperone DnaK
MLGGQDFDRILIAEVIRPWLMKTFSLPEDFQKQDKYGRLIGKNLMAAEAAKIDLSTANTSTIFMSDQDIRVQDGNGVDIYLDITVTRQQLEGLVEPLLVQTLDLSRAIVKSNGYTTRDIDRIVFIGGPSKMPWIRERVPRELGIAADLSVDPMTAVAMGAAIYAESREWAASSTKRKATRASTEVSPDLGLKFDYQARTTHDSVRLCAKAESNAVAARLSVQVDASEHAWTSGRISITHDTTIDLPIRTLGENQFRVTVFDGSGLPISRAASTIAITRTHSTAAAIPATQTIAVKVRSGSTGIRNTLQPLIKKGTPLPASGSQPLRAAYAIGTNLPGQIDLELFQDEGVPEPDLNLAIGSFRISHHDLPEGMMIKEGDPVTFNWSMDDSGLLTVTAELPSLKQTFSSSRFYVDQEGHRSFEGEAGEKLVETAISEAEKEAAEVIDAVGIGAKQQLDEIDRKLEEQRRKLSEASSGDERRSITETVRHTRQEVARLRFHPDHRGRYLEHKLNELITRYNNRARPEKQTPQSERFDQQSLAAMNELLRRTSTAFDIAQIIIEQMEMIYWRTLWEKPEFVLAMFDRVSRERPLSKNNEAFGLLVGDGENAIKANDVDELRGIVLRLWDNQINTANLIGDVSRLASVLRG